VGYLIATRLFQLDYAPGAWVWLGGIGAGALLVGVSGTLAVRAVVNQSPVVTLRGV
jgi:putative ABC transport system permease protein